MASTVMTLPSTLWEERNPGSAESSFLFSPTSLLRTDIVPPDFCAFVYDTFLATKKRSADFMGCSSFLRLPSFPSREEKRSAISIRE